MFKAEKLRNNKEIAKLLQFAYDLHEDGMKYVQFSIPTFAFYNGNHCSLKEVQGGGIFGQRGYSNHSQSLVYTILGICVGEKKTNGFDFNYAIKFETDNKNLNLYISKLQLGENKDILVCDYENNNFSDEEKVELFVKAMCFVGFNEKDVLNVIEGNLTAFEAYRHIAPENKKNLQWVNTGRKYFIFDNNVAIEGDFFSRYLDNFPFPAENPILDCSKVTISGVHFQNNLHKVKLININKAKSIQFSDLKNAIIEETIDLSKIKAYGAKFGHHTIVNVEKSKDSILSMDLSLAVDEDGKRYVFNDDGSYKLINEINFPDVEVMCNADNAIMAKIGLENKADGIGLVRTEHIFTNANDIKNMVDCVIRKASKKTRQQFLHKVKELQNEQVQDVLENSHNKKVIFRLMDFKVRENIINYGLHYNLDEEEINKKRGASLLYFQSDILEKQLEAIFEQSYIYGKEVNLLIPMIRNVYTFDDLKKFIIDFSKKYNLKGLKIGAMIENIYMANDADLLAKKADFISFGTNDLTESITGLSRESNSKEFKELTDDVKNCIKEAIYRARTTNPDIVIGICGEHSNYFENAEFYSKIGINYFTCGPEYVKTNKEILQKLKSKEMPRK